LILNLCLHLIIIINDSVKLISLLIKLFINNMTNIYILKLQSGKYYVGKTNNIGEIYKQYQNDTGSYWTKKYKPISIEQIIPNAGDFDEDKYTKEYMHKYGINNVRGGSYITEKLNDVDIYSIQKEIWYAKNLCIQCGRDDHSIKNCNYKKDVNGNVIIEEYEVWCCENCNKEYESYYACEIHERYCKNKNL